MIERRCVVTLVVVVAKNKNIKNPLKSMGGRALVSAFRFGLIRASSKSPNRKSITTFFQKAPILFKAINLKNRFRGNIIQRILEFYMLCVIFIVS